MLVFHAHDSLISTIIGLSMVYKSQVAHLCMLLPWLIMTFALTIFFSSMKLGIRLKIEVIHISITRVLALIRVNLDDLSFLYCKIISYISYWSPYSGSNQYPHACLVAHPSLGEGGPSTNAYTKMTRFSFKDVIFYEHFFLFYVSILS